MTRKLERDQEDQGKGRRRYLHLLPKLALQNKYFLQVQLPAHVLRAGVAPARTSFSCVDGRNANLLQTYSTSPTLLLQNGSQLAAHPQRPESPDAEAQTCLLVRRHHQPGGDGLHRKGAVAQGSGRQGSDGQQRGRGAVQLCL